MIIALWIVGGILAWMGCGVLVYFMARRGVIRDLDERMWNMIYCHPAARLSLWGPLALLYVGYHGLLEWLEARKEGDERVEGNKR